MWWRGVAQFSYEIVPDPHQHRTEQPHDAPDLPLLRSKAFIFQVSGRRQRIEKDYYIGNPSPKSQSSPNKSLGPQKSNAKWDW